MENKFKINDIVKAGNEWYIIIGTNEHPYIKKVVVRSGKEGFMVEKKYPESGCDYLLFKVKIDESETVSCKEATISPFLYSQD
jgi:hypothetical protein